MYGYGLVRNNMATWYYTELLSWETNGWMDGWMIPRRPDRTSIVETILRPTVRDIDPSCLSGMKDNVRLANEHNDFSSRNRSYGSRLHACPFGITEGLFESSSFRANFVVDCRCRYKKKKKIKEERKKTIIDIKCKVDVLDVVLLIRIPLFCNKILPRSTLGHCVT